MGAAPAEIFAPELHDRLLWFTRLRWWAVVGLGFAALAGPPLGMPAGWRSLLFVAAAVVAYNVYFRLVMLQRLALRHPYYRLQQCAVLQMVMDIAALLASVHFTGGLQSPLLPFFVFHMAIGTILVVAEVMYLIAFGTCWCALCLFIMEARGVVPYHAAGAGAELSGRVSSVAMLSLVVVMFGTVYLTDSVVKRFRRRTYELHQRGEELLRLEERKSRFMLLSAHQLRSPLGTVKTSLEVLTQGYVDPGSQRGRRLLGGAIERVDGLLAIVGDLLELAKLREGSKRAPWTMGVNVAQLVVDVVDAVTPQADARGIALHASVDPTAVLVRGVPPDLVYAIENLVQNAVKYSRDGGRVDVDLRVSEGRAVLRVADQGIGIPREFVGTLFVEFTRAPNARHHTAQGTGLGLAIVKEVVDNHAGAIHVESEEGKGTTITVSLPLSAQAGPAVTRP